VEHAADTDGQPGIAHVKISCTDGSTADSGEILAKGPQMLVGYIHAEDEACVFDAEGYFRTGDLGRWVDNNYLVIVGRAKDIIIRHGENIAPKEVEDLLVKVVLWEALPKNDAGKVLKHKIRSILIGTPPVG
jgi:long-subunit acyl-CoA synthetase (AMP-forming)